MKKFDWIEGRKAHDEYAYTLLGSWSTHLGPMGPIGYMFYGLNKQKFNLEDL